MELAFLRELFFYRLTALALSPLLFATKTTDHHSELWPVVDYTKGAGRRCFFSVD